MDLSEYFRRIGFSGPFERPDLPTLRRLHRLHVMSVPFENLSLHCGEDLSMDPSRVWDKIVRRGRGGWCFESGTLFLRVLSELGYSVTVLGSRVYSPLDNHIIGKVAVEGRDFIVDVSFGVSKQIWEPLELQSGKEQIQEPGVFTLTQTGDVWALEKTGRRPEVLTPGFEASRLVHVDRARPLYCFTLEPRRPEDFAEANERLQTDAASLFVNKSIASLQREGGVKALVGRVYSHVTYRPDLEQDLYEMREVPEAELEQVLREEFNIRLNNSNENDVAKPRQKSNENTTKQYEKVTIILSFQMRRHTGL
uniref:arylamine N-acetyltransferase n=1 Tax=Neogobius melanostomus TaxID=47308 RepID=A0A8C6TBK1_9GOBI